METEALAEATPMVIGPKLAGALALLEMEEQVMVISPDLEVGVDQWMVLVALDRRRVAELMEDSDSPVVADLSMEEEEEEGSQEEREEPRRVDMSLGEEEDHFIQMMQH